MIETGDSFGSIRYKLLRTTLSMLREDESKVLYRLEPLVLDERDEPRHLLDGNKTASLLGEKPVEDLL